MQFPNTKTHPHPHPAPPSLPPPPTFPSTILLIITIIVLQLQVVKSYNQDRIQTISFQYPAHTYQLNLRAGEVIQVKLTWQAGSDLDVVLYQAGMVINDPQENGIMRFMSRNTNKQQFQYSAISTDTYYLKIDPFASTPLIQTYRLQINFLTYPTPKITKSGLIYREYSQDHTSRVRTAISTNYSIYFSFLQYYTDLELYMVMVESLQEERLNLGEDFCYQGEFYVVFRTPSSFVQGLTSLQEFSYSLTYLYPPYYDGKCKKVEISEKQNGNNIGMIIAITVGANVLILIFVISFIFIRRKCMGAEIVNHSANISNLRIQDQKLSLNDQNIQKTTCAICLQNICNQTLECGHHFHFACITAWLVRNNLCPICRRSIVIVR